MIPDGQGRRVALMIDPKGVIMNMNYAIEPHVNPTSRYPLSDIDKAEGAPIPVVSSLLGTVDYFLLYLKRPSDEEK